MYTPEALTIFCRGAAEEHEGLLQRFSDARGFSITQTKA
jgi:hypothetical protein